MGLVGMGLMSMGLIIPRSEAEEIARSPGWLMVFGRRKTGKTFLLRRMVPHDHYFFVGRSSEVFYWSGKGIERLSHDAFRERLTSLITRDVVVIIDEFQRLPRGFLDLLHMLKAESRAKLILVGSSLRVVGRVFKGRSPLLGIVRPVRIGLISPRDVVRAVAGLLPPNMVLRVAPFIRDPWMLDFVRLDGGIRGFLLEVVRAVRYNVRGLIGEVFSEEERELTERYEAILKALGDGRATPGEVASYISGLLSQPMKSQDVKKYMHNLVEMGLVRRTKLYGKARFLYEIESAPISLFYYLEARIGFSEIDAPAEIAVEKIMPLVPRYYERFVTDLIAELLGGTVQRSLRPEIDGIIVRGDHVLAFVEVKYGRVKPEDLYRFKEKVKRLGAFRDVELIVVAENALEMPGFRIITPEDLLRMAVGRL